MRVLLDTSVLISYLLSPSPKTSAAFAILGAAIEGNITLLSVDGVFEELARKIAERPDLAARVTRQSLDVLTAELRAIGEHVERLPEPYAEMGRDPDDYFLLAHAVFAGADYLVSWDEDMLTLDPLDDLRIVTPPRLLEMLRALGTELP